ncbi:MAG: hypothetical protein COX77_01650 [Candidatus Komeilibacteria bacterium CG_4_10_14_0_2_um_filter_37_10]|uniref:Guanylate kinase-like domain-containing protein n=1 Tax=Candidatus Komeilibacteria bacterium CG_4_10_14_0_2_um_filter_37_10 TaxID=1974470 RepID=A0A2M7VG27_9BACT|nr:MAG: hypothetical protein COX77_01650 [Candidatus Komeilibacteria bacterium CG_4_10_14_0_2_um_filter_37_10]PJA93795.1 MAG: hypothetical protein CO133_00960 [Candidatus Komeilibacteria bacterium CG_4_9_14_3_um_filter_37_5]
MPNNNNDQRRVLVIAGPTCSGESTITDRLIKKYPIFTRLITATTRKPRLNEKNEIDYYFFTEDEFRKQIAVGNILEYTYFENTNTYYGSYKPDLENKFSVGKNIIMNLDLVGANYYKKNYDAITIFLNPGSLDVIKERLIRRDPKISTEYLASRLKTAANELDNEQQYYDYIVRNEQNKLEEALNNIIDILKKENYRLS